jgi:transposase-like protein
MERRKWPAEKRLEIVLEGIRTGQISEVCRRQGCSTAQYYEWQRQLLSSANMIFDKKAGRPSQREAKLAAELMRKDQIIAEVIGENLVLKKTFGG